MSRLTRFKQLTAAINTGAYGADAIAAGTGLAMLTSNLAINPIEGETQERLLDDGRLGNKPVAMIGTHVKITGSIEVAGAGTADAIPAYNPIMVACGYAANILADSVEIGRPNPGTEQDVTFYVYLDGVVHRVTGARGTLSTTINVNEIPMREFDITGIYAGHDAAGSFPDADFSQFRVPVKVGAMHTTLIIGGETLKMLEFELTDNNEINYDEDTVAEGVYLTDYAIEGRVLIEAPLVSDYDPIAICLAQTQLALQLTHGTDAGFIEQFDAPTIQLMRPQYGDRNGRMTWDIPFSVIGAYTITTR
jgi:hypothetical protein